MLTNTLVEVNAKKIGEEARDVGPKAIPPTSVQVYSKRISSTQPCRNTFVCNKTTIPLSLQSQHNPTSYNIFSHHNT